MESNKFIGIFDSGLGGLNVLNYLAKILPYENYIYFADTANYPFGVKDYSTLKDINCNIVNKLKKFDLKMIIIACGTVSTALLDTLKNEYPDIHFIGTFPGFEQLLKPNTIITESTYKYDPKNKLQIRKHTKKVLLLATSVTCHSKYTNDFVSKLNSFFDIYVEPVDELVKFVENNEINGFAVRRFLENVFLEYHDTDYLLLGCTHFPHLIKPIREVLGEQVTIINGCEVAANEAKQYLIDKQLINKIENKPYIKILDSAFKSEKKKIYYDLFTFDINKFNISFFPI